MTSSLTGIQVPAAVLSYRTYVEGSLRLGKLSRLRTWIILSVLAVAGSLLAYARGREPALLGTFAILGLCIALVPLAMRGIYGVLSGWIRYLPTILRHRQNLTAEVQQWVQDEFDEFDSSPNPRRFGSVYAVAALAAFFAGGAFDRLTAPVLAFATVLCLVASFLCGVGLASIFYLARFIWRLGRRYEVRVADHGYGVLSTGRTLAKCYFLLALVWCAYTFSGTWSLAGNWVPVLTLALPAVAFFVASFVVCQLPLHGRMVECKRAALLELDELLSSLSPTRPDDMTQQRQQQMDFCHTQIRRVNKWPEWPFSFRSFSSVVGASLGAVAPQLIPVLFPLLFKPTT